MVTMTAGLPTTLATALSRYTRANHPFGHRRHPSGTRTRRNVLHMLVGADSGRFHQSPRRRLVR